MQNFYLVYNLKNYLFLWNFLLFEYGRRFAALSKTEFV